MPDEGAGREMHRCRPTCELSCRVTSAAPTGVRGLSVPARQSRLGYLDALRGLAVLLVLVHHIGEEALPGLGHFVNESLALGPAGVMVFFACSGFIIPVSLERAGDLRAFWTSRFMRLYPLYWLSLALAAVLAALGWYGQLGPQGPVAGTTWLANVTMMQMFVGQPNVLVLYWTLAWEMLFYIVVSVLFVVGIHRRSVLLSVGCNAAVLAVLVVAVAAGRVDSVPLGLTALVCMFLGTVWYRWTVGEVSGRLLAAVVGGAAATVTVFAVVTMRVEGPPDLAGERRWPMLAAWLGAMAVFALGVLWGKRGGPVPAVLRRLGTVSYSVYLLQAVVIAAFPVSSSVPVGVTVSVWIVVTLALSEATYRWIEKPALGLGHRWARRWRRAPTPRQPPGCEG